MNANWSSGSKAQNQTPNFEAWAAEVQQEAHAQAGGLEAVQALGMMDIVQCRDGLKLDNHRILDQQVHGIFPYDDTVVPDDDALLLFDCKPDLAKLLCKRILIDLLDEPRSKRIGNGHAASNDHLGKPVEFSLICDQLHSSAIQCSSRRYWQRSLTKTLTMPPASGVLQRRQVKYGAIMSKAVQPGDVLGNAVKHGPICVHLRLKNLPLRCKLAAVTFNQAATPTDTAA
jgi:hypothetical protein